MLQQVTRFLKYWPLFIVLLPIFFTLHYLSQYYDPSLVTPALKLTFLYLFAGIVVCFLFWIFFRDLRKAALASFVLMAFNFFFGNMHDFLKRTAGFTFFSKYTLLIPGFLLMLLLLIFFLKKTKKDMSRTVLFLNTLFIVLILLDLVTLVPAITRERKLHSNISPVLKNCENCELPDIYMIITDEYTGKQSLKELFAFDNTAFETELKTRGFQVIQNSRSNYNATVYSIASMLNMNYVPISGNHLVNHPDMLYCRSIINNNPTIQFLKKAGYRFYNNSFFEFAGKDNTVRNNFFPSKMMIINSGTFINRFRRDMGSYFASKERVEAFKKRNLSNDIKIDRVTKDIALSKEKGPKFVYTHFCMPHHPYYLDSNGKETGFENQEMKEDKQAYLSYLLYTNKQLLNLVDHIKRSSTKPPVIMLMSDHGFRQLPVNTPPEYFFMTINAVFLPAGDYSGFYDGMSNVNQFRALFNTVFRQQLPMLKDSTIFLKE